MLSDVPVRTRYVEASAGLSSLTSGYARMEADARLREDLGLFAFTEADARERMAGAGAWWTFGW